MTISSSAARTLPHGLFIRAAATALLIALAGVALWTTLASLNARVRPDIPWAAAFTSVGLFLMIAWLGGRGWPERTQDVRRGLLRLRRPDPAAWSSERVGGTVALVVAIAGLYLFWILLSRGQALTDLSAYPTTAYRLSILVMGAMVSGVIEEAAFRGYMQSMLEPWGHEQAIVLTSVVFVLLHVTHGVLALLLMAPGYFIASYLYGLLAWRTGSILPGIVLHVLGDMMHTIFAVLGGDLSLLIR